MQAVKPRQAAKETTIKDNAAIPRPLSSTALKDLRFIVTSLRSTHCIKTATVALHEELELTMLGHLAELQHFQEPF
jgi:hypothetical protein